MLFFFEIIKGEEIIRQGEQPDCFYVIETGTFEVFEFDNAEGTNTKDPTLKSPNLINLLNEGESFGEFALMYAFF